MNNGQSIQLCGKSVLLHCSVLLFARRAIKSRSRIVLHRNYTHVHSPVTGFVKRSFPRTYNLLTTYNNFDGAKAMDLQFA